MIFVIIPKEKITFGIKKKQYSKSEEDQLLLSLGNIILKKLIKNFILKKKDMFIDPKLLAAKLKKK